MAIKNIIFFQGKTQYENTGDILINKSLIQLLRKKGEVIINDNGMPDWYVSSIVESKEECISSKDVGFNRLLIKSALFEKGTKVFLIAGPPGHLFGNSANKSFRNILTAGYFSLLNLFGVKIIKIGFSIGPVGKSLAVTERIRAIFTHYYLVRDSISLKLSKSIGIAKADFFPDLAWMYQLKIGSSIQPKRKIVISFRNSIFEGQSDDTYLIKLRESLFAMLRNIDQTYSFEVVYQVKRDYDFCKKLYDELKKEMNITFNETQITLDNAADAYAEAYCVITNRLHGALLGYKYGALPVILTDANDHLKIKGIYQDAGVTELLINIHDGINSNVSQFLSLLENSNAIIGKMNVKEQEYIALSDNILAKILVN